VKEEKARPENSVKETNAYHMVLQLQLIFHDTRKGCVYNPHHSAIPPFSTLPRWQFVDPLYGSAAVGLAALPDSESALVL